MNILGVGQISFWQGGSLWVGRGLSATDMHAHHAIQLCFGLDGQVRLRASAADDWAAFRAVLIPSTVPHALDASGSLAAALFCEPHSAVGRGLTARFGRSGLIALPNPAMLIERIAAIGQHMAQDSAPEAACQALLADLARTDPHPVPTDPRILRAADFVAAHLDQPIELAAAAAVVALSPGRFRHLFVSEMGLPFRAYVLWLRLQHALQAGVRGASWTEAAHGAGFADSAHLSRTFRRMLGVAPTGISRSSG